MNGWRKPFKPAPLFISAPYPYDEYYHAFLTHSGGQATCRNASNRSVGVSLPARQIRALLPVPH
jgi:hypothetical protein